MVTTTSVTIMTTAVMIRNMIIVMVIGRRGRMVMIVILIMIVIVVFIAMIMMIKVMMLNSNDNDISCVRLMIIRTISITANEIPPSKADPRCPRHHHPEFHPSTVAGYTCHASTPTRPGRATGGSAKQNKL